MTVALPPAPKLVAPRPAQPAKAGPTRAEIKARAKAIKKHRKQESRRFFHGFCWCMHALGFSF